MNDNKQQQHKYERRKGIQDAQDLLTDIFNSGVPAVTTGAIFEEAGLTIGSHAAIIGAIARQNNLELSKDIVDALSDSMLVGIELARRAGLKRAPAS